MKVTNEELKQIIREELQVVLDERCQKGYKTHPSRKTKEMFGRTYRNCVKAEEGMEEKKNPRIPRKKGQPARSDKHSDLYTDENPEGTIHGLKFATEADAKKSVAKIKKSGRSHAHKVQAAVAMEQRAKAAGKKAAASIYRKYINSVKKDEAESYHWDEPNWEYGGGYGDETLEEEFIAGGESSKYGQVSVDKMIQAIAKEHGVSEKQIRSEFDMGVEEEMEHAEEKMIAQEIALDHLVEDPEYYTKLEDANLEEAKKKKKKKKSKSKRKKAGTESSKESSLRDWFGRKGAKGKKKGWVDCNAPDGKGGYKSCGREEGEKRKKYPACRPTPSACKERGKGKSWGKKAKKKSKRKGKKK